MLTAAGGSFGKVFKAIDKLTGETVAIKVVRIPIQERHTSSGSQLHLDRPRRQHR
jgi:serine/threonine protein kinase